ncbi:MAG: nuclear transport factor 2 family protein, partial [Gaiellaceae bacterium MAG52_C11]|nr:nuclear transport factor 2 family protein [Candidatus Gaiellasilicea maunaloa]
MSDNIALAKKLINPADGNWQPLIDRLAEDAVFRVTIASGTPICPEIRGKQAIIEHFAKLGGLLEFRQEAPMEFFASGDRVVVLGTESVEIKKNGATVPGSDYATVVDFREGKITGVPHEVGARGACDPAWA